MNSAASHSLLFPLALFALPLACSARTEEAAAVAAPYEWERLSERGPFEASYNFPVHVTPAGEFVLLHSRGTWTSRDGASWTKSDLPYCGINSAYLAHVQHDGASWALGLLEGDYTRFRVEPRIQRTRDWREWEQVGVSTTLPQVVFYAACSFDGALWILGGHDGRAASASVWRSRDGLEWQRVVERAPWSPRAGASAIVFRGRLFLIGGGEVDGPTANDVWSSADGLEWRRECASIAAEAPVGFEPIEFDGKLWLVGANRSGAFTSGMLVSDDGVAWRAQSAPWSPRGGVAVWKSGDSLYLTGGKFSIERNGSHEFVYSNDVWRMRRK